jgi:hypothetical protein
MALAEVELVPRRYSVEDTSLTITFCPADVETAKLDGETLSTVPTTPPVAGTERALDPLLPGMPCAEIVAGKATAATTAMAVAPIAMVLVSCRKNMNRSLLSSVDTTRLRFADSICEARLDREECHGDPGLDR